MACTMCHICVGRALFSAGKCFWIALCFVLLTFWVMLLFFTLVSNMCTGFYSNMFIDYVLFLYGSECVSLGSGAQEYDGLWQGEGLMKWVLWKGVRKHHCGLWQGGASTNTMGRVRCS